MTVLVKRETLKTAFEVITVNMPNSGLKPIPPASLISCALTSRISDVHVLSVGAVSNFLFLRDSIIFSGAKTGKLQISAKHVYTLKKTIKLTYMTCRGHLT